MNDSQFDVIFVYASCVIHKFIFCRPILIMICIRLQGLKVEEYFTITAYKLQASSSLYTLFLNNIFSMWVKKPLTSLISYNEFWNSISHSPELRIERIIYRIEIFFIFKEHFQHIVHRISCLIMKGCDAWGDSLYHAMHMK